MRILLRFAFAVAVAASVGLIVAPPTLSASRRIDWFTNYDLGAEAASRELRPIMIDFWADWCGPCRIMDVEVYGEKSIQELLGSFVSIRIDVDTDLATPRRFFIKAMPTIVFLDPFGNEFTRHEGLLRVPALRSTLQSIPTDYTVLSTIRAQISPGSGNLEAILKVADFYRSQRHFVMSNRLLKQGLDQAESKAAHELVCDSYMRLALNYLALKKEKEAEKIFRDRIASCNCPKRPFHYLGLGKCLIQMGKKSKAREVYQTMLKLYPEGQLSDVAREALATLE